MGFDQGLLLIGNYGRNDVCGHLFPLYGCYQVLFFCSAGLASIQQQQGCTSNSAAGSQLPGVTVIGDYVT